MERRTKKHIVFYSILITALIASVVFGVYKNTKAQGYARQVEMDYQRCFTEMVQYVDDLKLSLEKSLFVNDAYQMMRLSGEIYRQASSASANLALLPLKTEPLENISEFLNQVGNYAYSLSVKMLNEEEISPQEYKNLSDLAGYADILAKELDRDLEDLYNGRLDIRKVAKGATESQIDTAMGEIEDQLHDYPALIYDGPFSSHLTDREPLFLEGMAEITKEEALQKAQKLSGGRGFDITEEKGNIPVFYLGDKEGNYTLAFTKVGGQLMYYLNDREVGDATKNIADAKIEAVKFLAEWGYADMKENYYETVGNVAVINYAPEQEGYVLYPDLIKVKVALDTGEIVGCEARGYIMYHRKREIPPVKVSADEAIKKVNPNVKVESVSMAVIPTDSGNESFCWQIEGRANDRRCLVYIDTVTGAEEKLFLLIESETGVLAV